MKKLILLCCISLVSSLSFAQNNKVQGQQFGPAIMNENVLNVGTLINQLKGKEEIQSLRVSGKVTDVCQKKGCWMKLENVYGDPVHVMFKDYGLFMPKNLAGKMVVMEGKAFVSYTPVEELRHYAEDAGKSKEEILKITQPKREIRFEAYSVVVLKD